MAQYQSNFYGTSYYGNTNAFSGSYETASIQTEEPLNGTFEVTVLAQLPDMSYTYRSEEIVKSGAWEESSNYLRSSVAGASLSFRATCDRVQIKYQGRPNGSIVQVKVTTTVAGGAEKVSYNQALNTNAVSISEKTLVIDGLSYGHQQVEITIEDANPSTKFLYFSGITARVCGFTIETRSAGSDQNWGEYQKVSLTMKHLSGNQYEIKGTSPNYANKLHVQSRIWMASSDNLISPEIEAVSMNSGDTSRRTENATYIAQINMTSVAAAIGQTFQHIKSIDWTSSVPDQTKITIRTRSTNDDAKNRWSAKSVPYVKGIKRIRLKEGIDEGFLITPLINPASINPFLRIDQWNSWEDISYLPPDESDVRITYSFLDERSVALYEVNQPKYVADKRLDTTPVGNKPYRLKINLKRRFDKATPVVDFFSLSSTLIYEEDMVVENMNFSAVNNQGTGEQMILDMQDLAYNIPAEAADPTFTLIDKTERPLDIVLYLDSYKNLTSSIIKPNDTKLRNDKIWARTKVNPNPNDRNATGLLKHYQYGGGNCIYGNDDETSMASSFTPALKEDRRYRYFITPGWFDAVHSRPVDGSINKDVDIYWKTEGAKAERLRINTTDMSYHNTIVSGIGNLENDNIVSKVTEEATWGKVEWVSEEKVFFGMCNLNDKKGDYVRKHETPESGDSLDTTYISRSGDTYESIAKLFGVEALDLRFANSADLSVEPTPGQNMIIPSRIVLPKINPLATIGANPYQVDIVYNSVMQGGKVVADERISKIQLLVEEQDVLIEKEEVIRGTIANGLDYLKNAKVSEIVGVWKLPNDPILAPNYTSPLDYKLTGNAISWEAVTDLSKEPPIGTKYYVTYKCKKPKSVQISIGSDYQEEGGINRVWRSPEVREFTGVCSPGVDHIKTLPMPSQWQGANNPIIEDLEFIIEDNDLWVKTWVQFDPKTSSFQAIGSLQDRIPKDNWLPYIHTGYYYLGKDEYYLFSEPITVEPADSEVARSENITYVPGKFANAAKFEKQSTNLVKNSGFESARNSQIMKITFKDNPSTGNNVAGLGLTT